MNVVGSFLPPVTTVLVNWQEWQETISCVKDLRRMDYDNLTVVVVDNGSTNDSVQRLSGRDFVLLTADTNRGFGAGCNIGIRYALERGASYVWLLNNDALADPDALRQLVKVAMEDPEVGVVGSLVTQASSNRTLCWGGGRVDLHTGRSHHITGRGKLDFISGVSMLLSAKAISDVGGFDEGYFMYWEDVDLCFRCRQAGYTMAVAEDSRIIHKESLSVGKGSLLQASYYSFSATRFMKKWSRHPKASVFIGCFGRALKSWAHLDLRRSKQVVSAALSGWHSA